MDEQFIQAINHIVGICGVTDIAHKQRVITHLGATTVKHLLLLDSAEISSLSSRLTKLPAQQRVFLTSVQLVQLCGMMNLLRDHKARGVDLTPDAIMGITEDHLSSFIEQAKVDDLSSGVGGEAVSAPDKFDPYKWVDWHLKMMNYFKNKKGCNKIPLYYVVRETLGVEEIQALSSPQDRKCYEAPHTGPHFISDNRSVWLILKDKLISTPAWEWIRSFEKSQNGKEAVSALRTHYNGRDQKLMRIAMANQKIKAASYTEERQYPFEKFATDLKGAFETLRECGEPMTEGAMVRTMTEKIRSNNIGVCSAVEYVNTHVDMKENFNLAVSMLSERVASHYRAQVEPVRRRISKTNRNPNQRNRNGIPKRVNGVDLSDIKKRFDRDEWNRIPQDIKSRIIQANRKVAGTTSTNENGRNGTDADGGKQDTTAKDSPQEKKGGGAQGFGKRAYLNDQNPRGPKRN